MTRLDLPDVDSYVIAMKLAGDPGAVKWIESRSGARGEFEWDSGNRTKLRKHGLEQADVEAIFQHPIVFSGRIVEPVHAEPRWLMLGVNRAGRKLALVFTRRGELIRPISCRSMRRNERAMYEEAVHEEKA